MDQAPLPSGLVAPDERLVMIAGGYGSGKTEVAIHLALGLADGGARVEIADLDLVNPYFRCREARALMVEHSIRVVVPPAAQEWADLPIVLPEVYGMLHPAPGTHAIFDVGGDDVGVKVLASLRCALGDGACELWQVINARRPFSATVEACLAMRSAIERSSRLSVTGWVANTHLLELTTTAIILEGWELAREVAASSGLEIRCVVVPAALAGAPELRAIEAPLLPLRRTMVPPWLPGRGTGGAGPHRAGGAGPHHKGERLGSHHD